MATHYYDSNCYCNDCCVHEKRLQERAEVDKERERRESRPRIRVEELELALVIPNKKTP